jgi:GNAT superfamily N-acetyltransferase
MYMMDQKQTINDIVVAPVTAEHAQRIAILSEQLGYPSSLEEIHQRIHSISASDNDIAYVALLEDHLVVGWIHVFYTLRLESPSFCEIGGLVVHEEWRGKGVGSVLVGHAKGWCKAKGIQTLRVRSNVKRKKAHSFYLREGFAEVKKQSIFEFQP